uniref:Uncharacterized protein n=1 Tax=Cajanus cajan TaxID=3821 RepID=A0A151SSP1_CAJCA|nr:hypothetical protein KK1_004074 [Cajanus cajan]
MKKNADQKRMDVEFNVGDKVLVKLQPYKQHSVALRKNQKLSLRYFGSFPIIERIGKVAYKLLLPETAKIHPVFHISQLKLCKGHHSQSYVPLPITSNDAQPVLQPAAILQSRVIIKGTKHVQQHLIQWEGLDNSQATWEDHTALESAFPEFNLGDKVVLNGGGNVMKPITEKTNQENVGTAGSGHVAVDTNDEKIRKSSRPKITNVRLEEYVWQGK